MQKSLQQICLENVINGLQDKVNRATLIKNSNKKYDLRKIMKFSSNRRTQYQIAGLRRSSSPLLFFLEYRSVDVYFCVYVRIESVFVRNMQGQNSF